MCLPILVHFWATRYTTCILGCESCSCGTNFCCPQPKLVQLFIYIYFQFLDIPHRRVLNKESIFVFIGKESSSFHTANTHDVRGHGEFGTTSGYEDTPGYKTVGVFQKMLVGTWSLVSNIHTGSGDTGVTWVIFNVWFFYFVTWRSEVRTTEYGPRSVACTVWYRVGQYE